MSSRASVKFRESPTGGSHYEHQRSDSGVGSFSDTDSRASEDDHGYIVPSYEDQGIYSIRRALEKSQRDAQEYKTKALKLQENLKEIRTDLETTKARERALHNENEILAQEKESLAQANKELAEQIAQLEETIKELKKTHRKSSGGSASSTSSATAVESSDEKAEKKKRSSSKRRSEKEKEKERERERGRDRESKDRERERERRREKERVQEERAQEERLRKRFDTRTGEESDAPSSNTSSRPHRSRHDSYIEPLGHSAPRPQAPVPPSPARQYSAYPATSTAAYSTTPAYQSIREPFSGTTPRSLHPTVYVADEYNGYGVAEEEDTYRAHRTPRHQR
ncbi:hypothetical protein VTI74DRAFT_8671 [Chaetomium olivicolor]